jgi:hypothetical protein
MPNDPAALRLVKHDSSDRETVSRFIRSRFRAEYDAALPTLMPQLFSLKNPQGETFAAFGLREAAASRLYMECYLDEPVERRISTLAGRSVARDAIVEVGNLAAHPGGARAMIAMLTLHLYAAGFEWVTFTGVAKLRAAFHRLGLQPIELAKATPERLGSDAERAAWGRYFEGKPIVMAGNVATGQRALTRAAAAAAPQSRCAAALAGMVAGMVVL